MATGFRRVLGTIQAHSATVAGLSGQDPVADHSVVAEVWDDIQSTLRPAVDKFMQRAQIQDEDTKVYGPKMVAKILSMHAEFEALDALVQSRLEGVAAAAAAVSTAQAAAEAEAEAERVATLEAQAARRAAERQAAAKSKAEAEAAAAAAAKESVELAEAQAAALAEARAAREAARLAEEEAYKAKQRAAVQESQRLEMQRMVEQQEARRKRAEAVLAAERADGGLAAAGLTPGTVNEVHSLAQLDAAIAASAKAHAPCVVDFFAPWCGPCVRFAPAYAAAAAASPAALFVSINCDAAPGVTAAKGVRAFPTFHVYVRGAMHASWSGADPSKLAAAVSAALVAEDEAAVGDALAMSMAEGAEELGGGVGGDGVPPYARLPSSLASRAAGAVVRQLAATLSLEQHTSALKLLRAYAKNVTEEGKAQDPKYRSIKSGNKAFHSRLGSHGAVGGEAMGTLGFSLDAAGTWQLPIGDARGEAAAADARPVLEAALRQALEAAAPPAPAPPSFPNPPSRLGVPGQGGGGGLAGLLNDPNIMAAAQQFMGGGGLDPSMLGQLGANPAMAQMAQQFMGNPGMMAAAQGMLGGAPAPAPSPAPVPAPTPAPAVAAGAAPLPDGDVPDSVLYQAVLAGLMGADPEAV